MDSTPTRHWLSLLPMLKEMLMGVQTMTRVLSSITPYR